MSAVRVGDKVRSMVEQFDVAIGREYVVTSVGESGFVGIIDDVGYEYGLFKEEYSFEYEDSSIHDIKGTPIHAGVTIAYAFAGAQSRHLALFEVQSVNGPIALCRSLKDGAVINLGVFEERAIVIK